MSSAAPRWFPAYVGIGSNLDSPLDQVRRAFDDLRGLTGCRLTAVSSLYQSKPMGPADQPDFINAAAALVTTLSPQALLAGLRKIEDAHGRKRDVEHWGPRALDLDLLVFADKVVREAELTVPHPGIPERNFVLLPLSELAPHLVIPGMGTLASLLAGVDDSGIKRLE